MKAKLQEKCIPPSYKSQLFSNMINLKQITLSIVEYSVKFEEARLRCTEFHAKDQFDAYTCFVNGLRFDIQKMVNTRPNNIRSKESSLHNSLPIASPIESKASTSSIVCHKCPHKGHISSRCSQLALALDVE